MKQGCLIRVNLFKSKKHQLYDISDRICYATKVDKDFYNVNTNDHLFIVPKNQCTEISTVGIFCQEVEQEKVPMPPPIQTEFKTNIFVKVNKCSSTDYSYEHFIGRVLEVVEHTEDVYKYNTQCGYIYFLKRDCTVVIDTPLETPIPPPFDPVYNPEHYGGKDNPYEAIKIIEKYKANFNIGNTLKYILRAGKKDNTIQDLKKAKYYLEREIDNLQKDENR